MLNQSAVNFSDTKVIFSLTNDLSIHIRKAIDVDSLAATFDGVSSWTILHTYPVLELHHFFEYCELHHLIKYCKLHHFVELYHFITNIVNYVTSLNIVTSSNTYIHNNVDYAA